MFFKLLLIFIIPFSILSIELKLELNIDKPLILIDNKPVIYNLENSDYKIDLNSGVYFITVCKDNFSCQNRNIFLTENKKLKLDLIPIQSVVLINSSDNSSILKIDGKKRKFNTPIYVKENKKIKISIESKNYRKIDDTIDVKLGKNYFKHYKLIASKVKLKVKGTPENSVIFLNGEKIGKKNISINTFRNKNYLKIEAPKYLPFIKKLNYKDGEEVISYSLKKDPNITKFSLGLSYNYGSIMGGYPDFYIKFDYKNYQIVEKIFYSVNFDKHAEYYGLVTGFNYIVKRWENIKLYFGIDLIFSHFVDKIISYNLFGIGVLGGISIDFNNPISINLEFINRLHYIFEDDFYNIGGTLSIQYSF